MLKYIYTALFAAIIITLNIMFGSLISWFLSITLIVIALYFVLQLNLEDIVNAVFEKNAERTKSEPQFGHKLYLFGKKWESILKFSCLTIVFVAAAVCTYFTMNPSGSNPWFLNNEYHGLSNTGIAFDKNLKLTSNSTDSNIANGSINITSTGTAQTLTFNHYYQPVVLANKDRKGSLLNNIFPQNITKNFGFQNNQNTIDLTIEELKPNLFQRVFSDDKNGLKFNIHIRSNNQELLEQYNLNAPFEDQITIESSNLKIGSSLFDLLLNARTFEASQNETYQILEQILMEFGASYILAHYENDQKNYRFFPGIDFFNNNYQFTVDGKTLKPQIKNSATIADEAKFYIGFNNYKKLLYFESVNTEAYALQTKTTALIFDYPNTFMLKSPGNQEVGNKNIRFITNDFDRIITDDLKEGFYFTTYDLKVDKTISGSIDYVSGKPNSALALNITDYNTSNAQQTIVNNKFSLQSKDGAYAFLFQVRDFSANGFSPEKTIFYLGIVFFAFIILTVGFPGKKLQRIEPIILMVILALTTLRFILYWRVATFPPLENISKYELEQTLINFDFNLGFQLPIPLTVIWILLFVLTIIVYRFLTKNKNNFSVLDIFNKNGVTSKKIQIQYLFFIGGVFAIHILNSKILHIEILTRILTILVPLIGYIIFAGKSNALYHYEKMPLKYGGKKKFLEHIYAYFYYFFKNPTTLITLSTLVFFAICDRGFAILFFLFLLLKNIFLNLLKKPLTGSNVSIKNRMLQPQNYWIFGFIAFALYLCLLSIKPLFYYMLTYKMVIISIILFFIALLLYIILNKKLVNKLSLAIALIWTTLAVIPPTHNWIDHQMNDIVKHVQYRASIIYQPIGDLLQQNDYTSFKTRKIIETAENQWFINSYISKPYDQSATINLRAHSRIGVDYPTQTRDVVMARYVISEWGDFSMYLILFLMLAPMIIYLLSFNLQLVTDDNQLQKRDIGSYTGLIPLIILFTLALFVWLTSTNRFVFFGQDFPFLSLTSKLSVLMPLLLFAITLIQVPTPKHSFKVEVKNNALKYALFVTLIAIFALTTVKENELNNENFSIVMETTKKHIDVDLNNILVDIQDSLVANKQKITYTKVIQALQVHPNFDKLKNETIQDAYSKSILTNLIEKPSSAFQLSNPLFMVYTGGRYNAMYNKNLYLELPPIEHRKIWQGSIIESLQSTNSTTALLKYNNETQHVTLPFFVNDPSRNIQFAILPKNWFYDAKENVGLLHVLNATKTSTQVFIYKNMQKNMVQTGTSFVNTINFDDLVTVYNGKQNYALGFQSEGNKFALNKWINGGYKIIYPLKENYFWPYSYANAIREAYSNDSMLVANNYITLDYNLSKNVQETIETFANTTKLPQFQNFNFSVIGADGDGNIRFMNDYVNNRKKLDPNDENTIYNLQRKQFFYSNAKNERDQWGNRNLLNLYLGPGSSIKPLTTGVIASGVNAGWEQLVLNYTNYGELQNFGGLKLRRPWKNDEHYGGNYDIVSFIKHSSNYYQGVMLFLGSYSKEAFAKNNQYNLNNLLTATAGANNSYPVLNYRGQTMYLPNLAGKKGNWPLTDKNETVKTYFGNENSILANGLEQNVSLKTKDKDKLDGKPTSSDKVNYVDPYLYNILSKKQNTGYLWSFPEESYFLMADRVSDEIQQNFNLGLVTPTLGGYPMRITPYKMAEMYLSMFTQNRNLRLGVVDQKVEKQPWQIDQTWGNGFHQFMASQVFMGMKQVLNGGTGNAISDLKGKYPNYHFYAKTGTINEQQSGRYSSRRLVIMITNKDLTQTENVGKSKVYALYFVTDNSKNFDWAMVKSIVDQTIRSKSFEYYFNK